MMVWLTIRYCKHCFHLWLSPISKSYPKTLSGNPGLSPLRKLLLTATALRRKELYNWIWNICVFASAVKEYRVQILDCRVQREIPLNLHRWLKNRCFITDISIIASFALNHKEHEEGTKITKDYIIHFVYFVKFRLCPLWLKKIQVSEAIMQYQVDNRHMNPRNKRTETGTRRMENGTQNPRNPSNPKPFKPRTNKNKE